MEFKPKGYNSVSPYFIVDKAQRLIDLLEEIFGATQLRRFDLPNGSIMHAELKIDDSVIMLADSSPAYPANKFLIHVYVPDVFKTFAKALELGCKSIEEPVSKKDDPDIRGTFEDFAGNLWAIGTQKTEG
jgi:uncharacterized glyoxalase superfamily protein PhnB